jgi:hypothetical protein
MSPAPTIRWVAVLLVCASCTERLPPSSREEGLDAERRLRGLLTAELRQQSQNPPFTFAVTDSAIRFVKERSRVLPGVSFIWATYQSHEVWHAFVSAVGGVRGDSVRVIKGPADWWGMVPAGEPLDEETLADACRELVHVTRGTSHMDKTRLYDPDTPSAEFLPDEENTVRRRAGQEPFSIERRSGSDRVWLVRAWLVRPTEQVLATRYECAIPHTRTPWGPVPQVTAIDSVRRY